MENHLPSRLYVEQLATSCLKTVRTWRPPVTGDRVPAMGGITENADMINQCQLNMGADQESFLARVVSLLLLVLPAQHLRDDDRD